MSTPKKQPAAEPETTALAARGDDTQVLALLGDDLDQYSGAGVSDRVEDFLLPFLYVAQSNSPQLKRQQADAYIPGMEAGDIFNTATKKFWRGGEGVLVVPAYYKKAEVEWITRKNGGGYVATHDVDTPLKQQVRADAADPRIRLLPNGHQLVETAYQFVVVVEDLSPAVFGMSSTALQMGRQWQTLMKDRRVRNGQGQMVTAPSFSRVYRLRTAYKQNDQGDWFAPTIEDVGWAVGEYVDAYQQARAFYVQALEKGVQMGRPPETPAGESARPEPQDEGGEPPI